MFNDPEWPLTQISRSHHYLTLNISEMLQDTDIVTTEELTSACSRVPFWMMLSNLAKYSTTRRITRPLCDRWAFCVDVVFTSMTYFDLLWPRPLTDWPQSWSFHYPCPVDHLCHFAAKWVHSFSNYRVHKSGNQQTVGQKHYASDQSRQADVQNTMKKIQDT